MDMELKTKIKEGTIAALPVVLGYLPVAIAFGLLSKNSGISLGDTGMFSMFVYAGASQFMALDLINAGVSAGSIILATFLLNLRHMMMTASLSIKLKDVKKPLLPTIAYGVTDETFSVLSFNKEKLTVPFVLSVNILSNLSWVAGTFIGYLMGEIIPSSLQSSLSIGLYAMFAALLFPQFKTEKSTLYLSILTAIVYILIYSTNLFTSGWDIIIGIIISSALGVIIFNRNEEVKEN
ncbi:AzlC family ABC transporter permease [Tissierella sp. Yu-01]|uniref:AzlC family ABC transporter permease n=1 Tax=Tissierella sp. Yu-01 TaxID=3035694 RepID=UPI00240E76A9|nr:AzlC family ABC transporter permease [Tissierella sp. Yu-01]WFA08452.1 AzlC family ABC transporter permease [Tissierella sp. Yu-01]